MPGRLSLAWLSLIGNWKLGVVREMLYKSFTLNEKRMLPSQPLLPGGLNGNEPIYSAGDLGSIPGSGRSPGEGKGSPLECPCLENPMDRGAWWAILHGAAKSQTKLLTLSLFTPHLHPQIEKCRSLEFPDWNLRPNRTCMIQHEDRMSRRDPRQHISTHRMYGTQRPGDIK